MYIGVKSDLFQLGMVLWAIAMEQDEPEIHPRPLSMYSAPPEVPAYYRDIVTTCLSHNPRHRVQASTVLEMFPLIEETAGPASAFMESVASLPRSMEEYMDPAYAVNRHDIDDFRGTELYPNESGKNDRSTHTYVEETEPYVYPKRGRSLSPRPVNGHSPSPQPLSAASPSVGNTLENTRRSPSQSVGEYSTENNFSRQIRMLSPPSPPPTAKKWMTSSPAYSDSEKLLDTHFLNLERPPSRPQTHSLMEDEHPRETGADQQDRPSDPVFVKSNGATTDHCADLAGVGAHYDIRTSLMQSDTGADTVPDDILADLEKLDLLGEDSHMSQSGLSL